MGLLARPVEMMRWVRRVLSPYSVTRLELVCLQAALAEAAIIDVVGEVPGARK